MVTGCGQACGFLPRSRCISRRCRTLGTSRCGTGWRIIGYQTVVRLRISMDTLREAEHLLSMMTRGEKTQVLQWVASDLADSFPGIDSAPSVNGGEACIVRTRIPVWVLVQVRRLGTSEADLLRAYPSLRAEDLA